MRDDQQRAGNGFGVLPRMNFRCVLILTFAVAVLGGRAELTGAQSETDAKIRLMAEALTARDRGEFAEAKAKLETLSAIVPNDAGVRRLITEMTTRLSEQEAARLAPPPPPSAPASSGVTGPPSSTPNEPAAERSFIQSAPAPAPATGPGLTSTSAPVAGNTSVLINPPSRTGTPPRGPVMIPVVTEERPPGSEGARPTPIPDRYAGALAQVEAGGVAFARANADKYEKLMTYVQAQRALARLYAKDGNYITAMATLDDAIESLKVPVSDLEAERREYLNQEVAIQAAKQGVQLRHRR